jgi:predicted transcriptional regulator with HTH domain
VRCQGALEYNNGIISDHRRLFVDLDPVQLFGGNTHDPVAMSSQGFTSKNEKKVTQYLNNLEMYLKEHKVLDRIDHLVRDAPRILRSSLKHRYEGINNNITHGMISLERKVKPKHFKYEWSIELNQAGYHVRYW